MASVKTKIGVADFAKALGCQEKFVLTRLKAVELADCCGRCGGSGEYSFNPMHGTKCFGCSGSGVKMPRLTEGLLASVVEAVAAGKLQPYLDRIKLMAEAKEMSKRELEDYASLTARETADVDAAVAAGKFKRAHWTIGSDRGFWTRSAAHPFSHYASRFYMTAQYEKSADVRAVKLQCAVALHKAMMTEAVAMVPADASDEIRDSHADGYDSDAHHAVSKVIQKAAYARAQEIIKSFGLEIPKGG